MAGPPPEPTRWAVLTPWPDTSPRPVSTVSWSTAKPVASGWDWPSDSPTTCGLSTSPWARSPPTVSPVSSAAPPPHVGRWPDAQGQTPVRPERRSHHSSEAPPPAADGAHRQRQGEIDRRVRTGVARLEPGLGHRRVPVREVGQMAYRGADRPRTTRRFARRDRRRGARRMAQDGLGLVAESRVRHRGGPCRRSGRGLGRDQTSTRRRTPPALRARRVHLSDAVGLGRCRRRGGDPDEPARTSARGRDRSARGPALDRGRRPRHRDAARQTSDGRRAEGPARHRVVRLPRVLVAAPASGHGKTTLATGLIAALTRRGLAVSGHQVGPDYIDPGYHALATGRPGRNLDPHLVGESLVVPLLLHGARGADVAVVEGVMGLFDGRVGGAGFASTAHVAALTRTPVVLVVDISHASRSIGAVVHGMRTFQPDLTVAGVVLNKAGSPRHAAEAAAAVEATGVPVLGVLHRDDGIRAPSRHLGLVPAAE